jgi:hypothetical protein
VSITLCGTAPKTFRHRLRDGSVYQERHVGEIQKEKLISTLEGNLTPRWENSLIQNSSAFCSKPCNNGSYASPARRES